MTQRLRLVALAALAVALAGCSSGGRRPSGPPVPRVAAPSTVVAAQMALSRAAQEDGQWRAFRQYAAGDAVMFVPQPVLADQWLRTQAEPAQAVQRRVHKVWSSCDGTMAVTIGSARWPDGTHGNFLTIWERQENGGHKWVLDQSDRLNAPIAEPDAVEAVVADCRSGEKLPVPPAGSMAMPATGGGVAKDGSLGYRWSADDAAGRSISVAMIRNDVAVQIVDRTAPAGDRP